MYGTVRPTMIAIVENESIVDETLMLESNRHSICHGTFTSIYYHKCVCFLREELLPPVLGIRQ